MIIKTYAVGMLQTNCYLVMDEVTRKCAVIDPGGQTQKILNGLKALDGQLEYILLTHGHFDHVLAAPAVQEATGASLLIHAKDEPWLDPKVAVHRGYIRENYELPRVDGRLEDGMKIDLGAIRFQVMHTPGHSKGSCIFVAEDVIFSGDTLFHECCGRCDLEGGDMSEMLDSLKRIAALPGDYRVLPGHEEETTLDDERHSNPYMHEALRR